MRFVYATRPRPALEFATASQRESIPEDAEVFAVCDGAMTIRQEPQSRNSLTNQEQSALEELIVASQISEAHESAGLRDHFARRIWRRLLSI